MLLRASQYKYVLNSSGIGYLSNLHNNSHKSIHAAIPTLPLVNIYPKIKIQIWSSIAIFVKEYFHILIVSRVLRQNADLLLPFFFRFECHRSNTVYSAALKWNKHLHAVYLNGNRVVGILSLVVNNAQCQPAILFFEHC